MQSWAYNCTGLSCQPCNHANTVLDNSVQPYTRNHARNQETIPAQIYNRTQPCTGNQAPMHIKSYNDAQHTILCENVQRYIATHTYNHAPIVNKHAHTIIQWRKYNYIPNDARIQPRIRFSLNLIQVPSYTYNHAYTIMQSYTPNRTVKITQSDTSNGTPTVRNP